MKDIPDLGQQFADANPEVVFHDTEGNGWTLVTLTRDEARADYKKVTDVTAETYTSSDVAAFAAERVGDGMTPLKGV